MGWILWLFLIAGQTADAYTTCRAISRGAIESNPLLPSTCGRIVAVKGAITSGSVIVALKATKKLRITIQISVGGIGFGATIWNITRR